MRYTIVVDQVKSLEWGLNSNQSALFSLLTVLELWAKQLIIDGDVYYFASRQMIIKEIPLYYSKPDTVYKALCTLKELGLIKYEKLGKKDAVCLTEKGKDWNNANSSGNSEINPSNDRNKSETNSEINPIDHTTKVDPVSIENNYTHNDFLHDWDLAIIYDYSLKYFPNKYHPKKHEKWLDVIDHLIRTDKRDKKEICKVIKWARTNDFWSTNFLSLTKLRKKNPDEILYYDVYLEQYNSKSKNQEKKVANKTYIDLENYKRER
jgi:hypothetical protein